MLNTRSAYAFSVITIILIYCFVSCSVENSTIDDINEPSFDNGKLILIASSYTNSLDSVCTVTAIVYKNAEEYAEDGTAIYFSTNKGTITPSICSTSSGIASILLTTAGAPGYSLVTAETQALHADCDPILFADIKCITIGEEHWLFQCTFEGTQYCEVVTSHQADCVLTFRNENESYSGGLVANRWEAVSIRREDDHYILKVGAEFSGDSWNSLEGNIVILYKGEFKKEGYFRGTRISDD